MSEGIKIALVRFLGGLGINICFVGACLLGNKFFYYGKGLIDDLSKKSDMRRVSEQPLMGSGISEIHIQVEEPIIDIPITPDDILQYQMELDQWFRDNFTGTAIQQGQLYERYVGYRWEIENYKVEYVGINRRGQGDGGIDLICRDGEYTWIVQCKNRKNNVSLGEIQRHSGVIKSYALAHPDEIVGGAFFTTSFFSSQSINEADKLDIVLFGNEKLPECFPIIKCKVENNRRFYFFPTDEGYDEIELDFDSGDCYCLTVSEAEKKGFRRGISSQIPIFQTINIPENLLPNKNIPNRNRDDETIQRCHRVMDRHTRDFEQREKLERIKDTDAQA